MFGAPCDGFVIAVRRRPRCLRLLLWKAIIHNEVAGLTGAKPARGRPKSAVATRSHLLAHATRHPPRIDARPGRAKTLLLDSSSI